MTTHIEFLGMAAHRIINSEGKVILIDPFLEENPVSPIKVKDLERVDLVLVTHLAFDHIGDAEEIAKKFGCPVCCGAEVVFWLAHRGVPKEQLRGMCWGLQVIAADVRVRGITSMHTSARVTDDGQFISGPPLGFIVYADPGVRVYHSGDTAIYSDLKLVGELYRPNIGLIGVGLPPDEFLEAHGYTGLHGNEMTADEAALAAQWLGVEYALANHYFKAAGNPDVEQFTTILNNLHSDDSPVVKPIILEPGDVFVYPPNEA
jgi:L-ascorbate metabolism protein UlaG (beta-lactamase superfamily)